jgi:hypothetical protein
MKEEGDKDLGGFIVQRRATGPVSRGGVVT